MLKKTGHFFLIFTLFVSWLFSGWPPIWQNPRFPPKVEEVEASIGAIKVEHIDFDIAVNGSGLGVTDVGSLDSAFFRNNTSRRTSAGPITSASNTNWNVFSAGAQLTSTNSLTGYRAGTQFAGVKMRGEVWRYVGVSGGNNEFIVRWRGKVTIPSGSKIATQAISGISNRNDVIPFVQGVVADLGSTSDGNRVVSHAHIDSSNNLVVERGETGTEVDVYVVVVEFTGPNWRVGHALLESPSTNTNNLTLKESSDGTGANFDTTDWSTAFIEASMSGSTASNQALEDTSFVIEPRAGFTTDAVVTFDSSAGLAGAEVFVHVLQHDNMAVTRYTKAASIPLSADNTVSGLTNLEESALEWYVFTDGTGDAYARGATTAHLTSTTNVAEWTHRTGNNGQYRYGVIDLSGITISVPVNLLFYNDDGGNNQIAFNNIRTDDVTPTFRVSATNTQNFNRFQVELHTDPTYGGAAAHTQNFNSTYTSNTEYNLTLSGFSPTNNTTYYIRARASDDNGGSYGLWSEERWTYTHSTSATQPEWYQTTDEQFSSGALGGVEVSGADSVQRGLGNSPVYEAGEVTVADSLDWTTITYANSYSTTPVVLATPVTANHCEAQGTCAGNNSVGGMYPIPIVRNVTTTSFDISMCVDGGSQSCATGVSSEDFHWFVFDVDTAANYDWIEVGTTPTVDVGGGNTNETYATSFSGTPDVWTQAQTYSQTGELGAVAWTGAKSSTGFTYVGCVHTAGSNGCQTGASTETFGYVAIDVTNAAFPSNLNFQSSFAPIDNSLWAIATFPFSYVAPRVMVAQNSDNGGEDPQYPWARNVTTSGMDFRFCEQDDATTCNSHISENIHWFALEELAGSSIMSPEIDFDWASSQTDWGGVSFSTDETNGDVKLSFYYTATTTCDTIIPNSALSGNESGFDVSASPIDISGLDTTTYNRICLLADFTDIGGTPYLNDWTVAWGSGANPTFEQSAYRLFNNNDSTDVGVALAVQDTAATLGSAGDAFRLRLLLHVGAAELVISGESFKLQFAEQSGTCDSAFLGETYTDVTTSTVIAYNNNPTPTDGDSLTSNANDPTHSGHTVVNQTYEELSNFTNSVAAISSGQDGKWDFSLVDNGAVLDTPYCFRVVKSDGSPLSSYSVVPEIITGPSTLTFSISESTVGFGTLSSVAAQFATANTLGSATEVEAHTIVASTNAPDGYAITINGETLSYGTSIISAIGSANTASSVGTEQFGLRMTASGGNGSVVVPYAAAGFAFDTAAFPDVVASNSGGDGVQTTYSLRYLANISGITEAGDYQTTLTYVITAAF